MVEPTWVKLVATLVFVAGIVWFVRLQFKIRKPIELESLPDEKDVIGKDLPVGFRYSKDGHVVEVEFAGKISASCYGCVYKKFGACNKYEHICLPSQRKDKNFIIFKKGEDHYEREDRNGDDMVAVAQDAIVADNLYLAFEVDDLLNLEPEEFKKECQQLLKQFQ